jgi:glycosyltransferase involved in cell wall biosynthesis
MSARLERPERERSRPLSVLLLTGQFLPVVGGTELATQREAQALQARGHTACVLTLRHNPRWPATEVIEEVSVRRTGGMFLRGKLRLRYGASWLAEARVWFELVRARRDYDVVHVRQLGRLTRPAALASYFTGKPLVVRVAAAPASQDGWLPATTLPPQANLTLKARMTAKLKARANTTDLGDLEALRRIQYLAPLTLRLLRAPHVRLLALSARIRQSLIKVGFAENQIVLLPNGVNPATYEEIAARRARTPVIPGERQTVVCLARLAYQKGQDTLLQAWRIVQARMPTTRLILAGEGGMRAQFECLAASLGVAETVEFAGLVTDTRSLLAEAHAFVLPSRFEGMPNALLEAMAAGLPCVATRVSGSEDIIVDGQSGLLVPPDDPKALASALLAILTDPERASAMGREARARVSGAFSQDHMLNQLIQLYSSLAGNGDVRRLQTESCPADVTQPALEAPATAAVSVTSDIIPGIPGSD